MQWKQRCPLLFYAFFIKRNGAYIIQNRPVELIWAGFCPLFLFFTDSGLKGSGLLRELIGVGLRPGRALVKKLQILSDWGRERLENHGPGLEFLAHAGP